MSIADKTVCNSLIHVMNTRDTCDSWMVKRSAKSLLALPRFSFTNTMKNSSMGCSLLFGPHFFPTSPSAFSRSPVTHGRGVWLNVVRPEELQCGIGVEPRPETYVCVTSLKTGQAEVTQTGQGSEGLRLLLVATQKLDDDAIRYCTHAPWSS